MHLFFHSYLEEGYAKDRRKQELEVRRKLEDRQEMHRAYEEQMSIKVARQQCEDKEEVV